MNGDQAVFQGNMIEGGSQRNGNNLPQAQGNDPDQFYDKIIRFHQFRCLCHPDCLSSSANIPSRREFLQNKSSPRLLPVFFPLHFAGSTRRYG
jgi:hypothetical protein